MAAMTSYPLRQCQFLVTRQEACRIHRALYRFEIYRNLFCQSPAKVQSSVYGEQNELFFSHFAPWENEQLGCIHDFLARIVLPGQSCDATWANMRSETHEKAQQLSMMSQNTTLLGVRST